MKRFALLTLALFLATAALSAKPASAQTVSLLDPVRLSVGARAYRSFDEVVGNSGTYSSGWWVGIPAAWEITSPKDPSVKLPISLIAALDIGMPDKRVRGYVGFTALLKRAGQ